MDNTIALEENKDVLLESLKAVNIGFWELDLLSGTFKTSSVLDEILGIGDGYDLTIEGWLKLIHPDDREVINDYFKNFVIAQKNPFDKEYRIQKNNDKSPRWIHSVGKLKFDSDNNVTKIFGIAHDLTERKNAVRLRNLRTKLLIILNSSKNKEIILRDTIALIKDELNFSAVGIRYKEGNDYPYLEQSGFSDSFLRAENSLTAKEKDGTLCVDKDGNIILDCTCGLVISGINHRSAPFLTEAGSFITNNSFPLLELTPVEDPRFHPRNTCIHRKYGSVAIIPIKDENRIVGTLQINDYKINAFSEEMVFFLEDICLGIGRVFMRITAKDLLENKERFLQEVQETGHIGTYKFDVATNKWQCSSVLADIFGIDANYEMSYESWLNLVQPEHRGMMHDYLVNEILGKRNKFDKVYKIVRVCDQTVHWVHGFGKITLNDKNEIISLIGTISDITEQKYFEHEREKAYLDVIERNKDLEQFSYIVSHNLRAPVANIIGLSNMMLAGKLTPKEEKGVFLGLATSVEKLDNVVRDLNDILDIRNQTNKMREIVRFSELVMDISTSINKLIVDENVIIISDFTAIDEILTIKGYLYSIFYNLISNSIKYRQPGTQPIIEINSMKQENSIELIFKDNGIGIDMAKRSGQIFGLYKRFNFQVEGKGVGLFMVKNQVESIGGKISVDSELGKGTIFTIIIPINDNV